MIDGILLGPLLLRWNGVLIALGIAFAALLAALEAKRRFQDVEIIYYLFVPVTVWSWVGARLWHVLTPPLSSVQLGLTTQHYLSNPLDILAFWIGGFGIPGALLGGTIALWWIARKDQLPFWELTDMLAPGLVLAQILGRLGNYFNQELYGLPTDLPWAIFIQPDHRLIGYEQVEYYHPLFVYEILLNVGCLLLVVWLSRGRLAGTLQAGDTFLVYLGYYSLVRFLLEFIRLDVSLVGNININQVFFAALLIVVAGVLFYRQRVRVL